MKLLNFIKLVGLAAMCFPVHAHHTSALYEVGEEIIISGTVVRYEWRNPHVYLWVEGKSDSAIQAVWEIEGHPPAMLRRMGWSKETLTVGDMVMIKGQPGRDKDKHMALMLTLEKADNTVLNMDMQAIFTSLTTDDASIQEQADGLAGTWVTLFNFPAVFQFVDTSNLPRTEEGIAVVENYVEAEDSPYLDCVAGPSPLLMLIPDVKAIEVSGATVIIRGEMDNSTRTIYLNRDSHDGAAQSMQGHSIGHWEDGTLVIDTARFSPNRIGNGAGLSSGPDKHLVERLTLDESGTKISYSFTLEDPDYLTAPVTGAAQLVFRPDIQFEALPCDIENARRFTH